ncbi:MAG: hypothetical protein F6K63_25775 [Moorea sp. SIO1G6]|uniref:hypothetical protein n=1 Tax=unclassified Moorena TaxID=2683338 RepID=UPI0013BE3A01|nr:MULTISPECIES: hypothetical protein [unclassified Moorena]NEQ08522.1 hypothetical protein [Moorena sp. SIO4E2]NEQ13847.1 hypothetical protein [Moorena sp. SIO3E2]NES84746.1 hypothetical protein [Moorena sp. SIO2B7]NET67608.1 hypothetical protein [Moorena sp. SIO1G6]
MSKQGLKSKIKTVKGKVAKFVSTVEFLTPETFLENGKIEFGSGNTLTFETVGQGFIGPSPEEGVNHGVVDWKIVQGTGVFIKATGLITSNFTVGPDGEVTDNQFGVIYLN